MLMVCRGSVNAPTISARYSTRWIRYVVEKKMRVHSSIDTYVRAYVSSRGFCTPRYHMHAWSSVDGNGRNAAT
jgi:hypothetical protein